MLCQRSYGALKQLYPFRKIMNTNMKLKLCESLIVSRVSYGDVVYGPNLRCEDRLRIQKILNSCLRLCYGIRKFEHISHKYSDAGWLKFDKLLDFRVLVLTHGVLQTREPKYLYNKLSFLYQPNSERSSRNVGRLLIPRHRTASFQRSFSYKAPKLYNSINPAFYNFTLINFKKKLKAIFLSASAVS